MTAETINYISPNNVSEKAIASSKMPGGKYKPKDKKKEQKLLSIDFYSDTIVLCPKTWSTSPATMVRDISQTRFKHVAYERSHCKGRTVASQVKKLAKYKLTMNQRGTSGTFSTSSLLYYHFSRYFDTATIIPVAIYRDMDRNAHRDRVTRAGARRTSRGMIARGWNYLNSAEKNPNIYRPKRELFTSDGNIYGVLLRGKGARYGAEINGARKRRWGSPQNEEFQETAPYWALRTNKPLLEAMATGRRRTRSTVRKATGTVSNLQMFYWMRELTEIVLFDYIFSQQDRVGNIDYRWAWYWKKEGKVKSLWQPGKHSRRQSASLVPPDEIKDFSPILIQRTCLNDNDAGARVPYANFSKRTGMLSKLRHFSAKTYTKLIELNSDLQDEGPIYQYLHENFILDSGQHKQIVRNTQMATDILKDICLLDNLHFDLDNPKDFFLTGLPEERFLDCIAP